MVTQSGIETWSEDIKGKVAIVTGSGRGIGRSHALGLAAAGVLVVVNDLAPSGDDPDVAAAVVEEIRAAGGVAIANHEDISQWEGAGRLVDAALGAFGSVDFLVNNAGMAYFNTVEHDTRETWDRVINVNLSGGAALIHRAGGHWRKTGPRAGRAIVNTSSPVGLNPMPGMTSYCAAKAGVVALTIGAACELAELGVRVNAIAPIARTRQTEHVEGLEHLMQRPTKGLDTLAPENVTALVMYLLSSACDFTGRIFGIQGDDLYLVKNARVDQHFTNGGQEWTSDALIGALADVDRQDRAYAMHVKAYYRGSWPSSDTLAKLATFSRLT